MEIKRVRIKNFEHPPLVRDKLMLIYRVETDDGRKVTLTTTGDWKIGDVVDAIVKGLTNERMV